jgi:hypothetical protein
VEEALALISRTEETRQSALEHAKEAKGVAKVLMEQLQQLGEEVEGYKVRLLAENALKGIEVNPSEGPSLSLKFPPECEPIHCRPLLFDLALAEVKAPSLEGRKKSKGGFWNFWRS